MSSPYRTGAEVKEEKQQPFPLENILTMSAQDYVGPGVRVTDKYEVRGVHASYAGYDDGRITEVIERFKGAVPPGTEIVVDYKIETSVGGNYSSVCFRSYASGVALIPKPQGTTQRTGPR